ncbi:MAG TPA: hypothetical protein VID03_05520 [Acidimicrobiia bacterium]
MSDESSSPGSRAWHTMAIDRATGNLVICGGAVSDPLDFRADTWTFDQHKGAWELVGG